MTYRPPTTPPARPGLYDACRIRMHYAAMFAELDKYGISAVTTLPLRRWYRQTLDRLIDGEMGPTELQAAIHDVMRELRTDGELNGRCIEYAAERLEMMREEVTEYIERMEGRGNK